GADDEPGLEQHRLRACRAAGRRRIKFDTAALIGARPDAGLGRDKEYPPLGRRGPSRRAGCSARNYSTDERPRTEGRWARAGALRAHELVDAGLGKRKRRVAATGRICPYEDQSICRDAAGGEPGRDVLRIGPETLRRIGLGAEADV